MTYTQSPSTLGSILASWKQLAEFYSDWNRTHHCCDRSVSPIQPLWRLFNRLSQANGEITIRASPVSHR